MSKLFRVEVNTTDNPNDYLKDFLRYLKLRTYRMPEAKIWRIFWYGNNKNANQIMCNKDMQNAFELDKSGQLRFSVDLLDPSATGFGAPDFDVDSVCTKCGKAVECGSINQSSSVVAVSDLAESLQLVTFEMDKISQLATSASVQLRTVNNAVSAASSSKAHTVD